MVTLVVNCLFAQFPSAPEIKKIKLKSIVISTESTDPGATKLSEIFYDANGNDTARYNDGVMASAKTIEYNQKQQPVKITHYDASHMLTGTTEYKYKADNSFTTVYTDKTYGMKDVGVYDRLGKLVSFTIPDGSVKKYSYNTKGQLIKAYSIPRNEGVKMNTVYTYNAAGKLISSKSTGDYPGSDTYEYDKNGLLKKSVSIYFIAGEKQTDKDSYQFKY